MPDPVSTRLAGPGGRTGIGTILHLGAGTCRELAAYLASDATDIVLVEPDPAAARVLEARAGDDPRVRLHELALAAADGEGALRRFNLAGLSSLRAPEALGALFPGLRCIGTVPVTTTTMGTLLAILPGPGPRPDVLVIDAPGEEATVIEGLQDAGALTRFRRIFLHAGTSPLHAGSTPLDALQRRLEDSGYRLEGRDDSDPDRPCLEVFLPQAVIDTASRMADLETALAEARAAAQAAEEARSAQAAQAAEAREALGQACRRIETLQAEAAAGRDGEAEALERLRADLSLALRQQTLREADLDDLRARHARLLAQKQQQDALLGKLTERLALAAGVLERLELAQPEIVAEVAAGAALPAGAENAAPPPAGEGRKQAGGRKKKRKAKA